MNHIAYIAAEYPHTSMASVGGIGSFVKTMATSLGKKKCDVTIFLCFSGRDKVWYDNAIKIVEIKKVKTSKIASIQDRLKIRRVVSKYVKETNIELIEAPDWEGLHAFCNFKIPLVTRIHGSVSYFNFLEKNNQPKIIKFFEKKAFQISNKVIAVSEFSGKLTKEVFDLPELNFEVIYNGVNLKEFKTDNQFLNQDNTILYFGTLVRKKGVIELAHIFNILHEINPEAKLVLIGKDAVDFKEKKSTWSIMKRVLTESAQKKITYNGAIPYQEMRKAIDGCSVCVFPSFAEAFPISWLEAMALQKPIVASSIGWATESLVDEESGLLEHPKNHSEFARKINSVLTNQDLANKLKIKARKRVEISFNQEHLINKNIEIYKKLIDNE